MRDEPQCCTSKLISSSTRTRAVSALAAAKCKSESDHGADIDFLTPYVRKIGITPPLEIPASRTINGVSYAVCFEDDFIRIKAELSAACRHEFLGIATG